MNIDIRLTAQLTERTQEDNASVYIQDNIVQVEWDRPFKLDTYTFETAEEAQRKFDNLTQNWYQEGPRDVKPKPMTSYFDVGHKNKDTLWMYHDGEIKTAPGFLNHGELAQQLGLISEHATPKQFNQAMAVIHRGRYEPSTGKVSYISLDGHEMPSWLQTKLEEKFGDIEVETFANNGADGSFNAWISPKGKLLNLLDGDIKDAWITHWEYANQVLGFEDIHGAFKHGYVRVSIAPQGHSIVQARELKKSLPIIQKALKDTYEKVGSIPIWVEDEFGEWDAETDLGKLVSATNLEELKELASNPESPSTDKILQTLEQEGYGLTDEPRLACWMTPDGEMINCSGDGRTRGIDHREISNVADVGYGNTAGMHRLMQLGFIRLKPEAPGFDLATAPTSRQRLTLAKWLSEFRGDEIFVEAYDAATYDARNEYFNYARHQSFEFERGENPGRILSEVEDFFTVDTASNPASSNPPITERLLAMGVHPDVVAYVDTLNEHPKIQGMLFKEFKAGKFEKLGDVMAFVEAKLPKGPVFDEYEQNYIRIAEIHAETEIVQWFKYQLPKLRVRQYAAPEVGGGFTQLWEHNWQLTPALVDWDVELGNLVAGFTNVNTGYGTARILPVIFLGISDWLAATGVNINSYSWREALEAVREWHQQQCQVGDSEVYDHTDEDYYVFPDGYRIVKVTSANNLEVEGNKMRHCVGSYADRVQEGSVEIYSLRDEKNEPHVTIEVDRDGLVEQIKGVANSEPKPEYKAKLKEWFTHDNQFKLSANTVFDSFQYGADLDEIEEHVDRSTAKHNEYGLAVDWSPADFEVLYDNVATSAEKRRRVSRSGEWRQHGVTDSLAIIWANMSEKDQKEVETFMQEKESAGVDVFDRNWYFEGAEEDEHEARDNAIATLTAYALPNAILNKYYELKKAKK